jgi:hypothetical protein
MKRRRKAKCPVCGHRTYELLLHLNRAHGDDLLHGKIVSVVPSEKYSKALRAKSR